MAQFALLLREDPAVFSHYSPDEMQRIIERYRSWRMSLPDTLRGGSKLTDGSGRVLRSRNGKPHVADGPFAESKEVMGGFFLIEAENYDRAVALAKTCPHMEFGSIEVREIEMTLPQK
jgi:hypothetical protein